MRRQALINIGLSGNEADIYLALLELGPSLVSKIVEKTGINRTNIYDRLERLIDRGLVAYVIKSGRKHFSAAEPKRILRYLEEKKSKIIDEQEQILVMMPEFDSLKPNAEEESVEIYEGKEGLKTILEEIIRSKMDILTYGSEGNFSSILKYYFKHYLRRLEKNKIKMKVIFNYDDHTKPFDWKFAEVRYIPKDYKSPTETTIYGDTVVIFLLTKQPKAIVMKSKTVVQAYRNNFSLLWKIGKELNHN